MQKNFLDIEIGDSVICYDDLSHDYYEHELKIEGIEYDEDSVTDTNPKGIRFYGADLDEEEWGDDYLTWVTENNFCRVKELQ